MKYYYCYWRAADTVGNRARLPEWPHRRESTPPTIQRRVVDCPNSPNIPKRVTDVVETMDAVAVAAYSDIRYGGPCRRFRPSSCCRGTEGVWLLPCFLLLFLTESDARKTCPSDVVYDYIMIARETRGAGSSSHTTGQQPKAHVSCQIAINFGSPKSMIGDYRMCALDHRTFLSGKRLLSSPFPLTSMEEEHSRQYISRTAKFVIS